MTKQKHFYLIRGLIREKGHWGSFLDHMESVFPNSLITTIDIPGAGDYYKSPTPITIKQMVEQMRQDYLKYKTPNEVPILVAISLGGMIAVEWMKTFPDDFQEAVLINTSFGRISPIYKRLRPSAFIFLMKTFWLKGRDKEHRILKLVSNNQSIFDKTLDVWEVIQKERPVTVQNTLKQLTAAFLFSVKDFDPPIPVHILTATHDRMVNVDCSRSIAKKWKLKILEHPAAGHDLTTDDPRWVAEKIQEIIFGPLDGDRGPSDSARA